MLHVDSSGGRTVSGANTLVALFSERESHAAYFLQEQDMTRYDAVNFMMHGLPKTTQSSSKARTTPAPKADPLEEMRVRNGDLEHQLSMAIARITDLEKAVAEAKVGVPTSVRRDEYDVFVSYRREQKELVRSLVERLRADGLLVWWDNDIPAGAPWEATIERFIGTAKVVVVCWSSEAIKSDSVKAEARFGRDRNKLIQVFLDACQPPMFFGERQGFHFEGWRGEHTHECYRQLLEGIRIQL